MTNFLNRALIRRKRKQNGDAAGKVEGGRTVAFSHSVQHFRWRLHLTLAFVKAAQIVFFPPLFSVDKIKIKHTQTDYFYAAIPVHI